MDGPSSLPPAADAAALRLRLLVTAHFVFSGRVGGAEHMLYNLVKGLAPACAELSVLCASERNLDPGFTARLRGLGDVSLVACGGDGGTRFAAEQRACLRPGVSSDAVLFPNYFVPPLVPRRLGRVVSVLHDMQYRHFPQNFSAKKRAWLALTQGFALRRSDTVVAISEFVRQDILRCYGQRLGRRVITIPNPISWDRFTDDPLPAPMSKPYILSVAAQYAHKNLGTLVRAFALVARQEPELQLVLCGQDYKGLRGVSVAHQGVGPLVEELGLGGRVHMTGYVDDATLGRWYRGASMFAFPSVFEGFGMPPVEALGFGLPTVTTRRTALPEVTLGLAHYVDDPFSIGEWAARLLAVARDPGRHRPNPAAVAELQAHYNPSRIGRLYAQACAS